MSLKDLREDLLGHALLVWIFVQAYPSYPIASFVLVMCMGLIRGRKTIIFLFLLCLLSAYRLQTPSLQDMEKGRVISVRESYFIAEDHGQRIMLYSDTQPVLDSVIAFTCTPETIVSSPSFFHKSFAQNMADKNVRSSCRIHGYQTLKESHSLRGYMQKRSSLITDEEIRRHVQRILLDMNSTDNELVSSLRSGGFSLIGIPYLLTVLMKYFTDRKRRAAAVLLIQGILCLIYRFPVGLTFSFLYKLTADTKLSSPQRLGLSLLVTLWLYPYASRSSALIILVCYRLFGIYHLSVQIRILCDWCLQSILFHRVRFLRRFLFGFLLPVYGYLWLLSFFCLFYPLRLLPVSVHLFDQLLHLIESVSLPGSILGAGLPVFLILVWTLRRHRYAPVLYQVLFLFFLGLGLFHPLAEVIFINIGQGDAILVRQPCNTGNILIDTGRPSALDDLCACLDHLGIRKIDVLFISHEDSDHSGNLSSIQDIYHAQVIRGHFTHMQSGRMVFQDISKIVSEDENRSSQVLLFSLNGLDYLMTGDIDTQAEEILLREYDGLHCDILKLAHHGSDTASSDAFLEAVRPSLAVISAGLGNKYGHPHESVLQRLKDWHIPYLCTSTDGDIRILCLPGFSLILSAGKNLGILLAG